MCKIIVDKDCIPLYLLNKTHTPQSQTIFQSLLFIPGLYMYVATQVQTFFIVYLKVCRNICASSLVPKRECMLSVPADLRKTAF